MIKIAAIAAGALIVVSCGGPKVQNNGNPNQAGPSQKIHLIWKGTEWKVKLNGGPEENPKTATTKLDSGVGPTMFEVNIEGGGPNPPTFKESGGLSVWAGDKSSPQSGVDSTQILGPVVTKQGKLVFWDLNQGDAVTLSYSLHFNEAGVPSVDPIIKNGGGG
jgi:hypothetical protein